MQADPSPTAAATRFVLPERTSPTANTRGKLGRVLDAVQMFLNGKGHLDVR